MNTITRIFIVLIIAAPLLAEEIHRTGNTTASFLEIGMGSAPSAMGEAYVAMTGNLASAYWNPAGLAYLDKSQLLFMHQPWIVDINTVYASGALVVPRVGTIALSVTQVGYGDMEVTTLSAQDGTGELFTANDMAAGFTFSRRLAQWFGFGVTGKYIKSQIRHMSASAGAIDMGVIVNTDFFSRTGNRLDGLTIGMSFSNYGTRMRYDGIDLLRDIDISLFENGNFADVRGQFRTSEWELPLIFRIGVTLKPIVSANQQLVLAVDLLHPNNNPESINTGIEYSLRIPNAGKFHLRGGYKALGMEKSEFGLTGGGGFEMFLMGNRAITIDYAFKEIGILGRTHAYTIGVTL